MAEIVTVATSGQNALLVPFSPDLWCIWRVFGVFNGDFPHWRQFGEYLFNFSKYKLSLFGKKHVV